MVTADVRLGRNVVIPHPELVNLYGCTIGDDCKIASFVEIQRGVVLGNNVKVEAFAFIPTGVRIEDGAFIGPHVCFTNDRYPRAAGEAGELLAADEWQVVPTLVKRGASIGANATIVCGVTIGENSLVGAGSTITRDVAPNTVVLGSPGRPIARVRSFNAGVLLGSVYFLRSADASAAQRGTMTGRPSAWAATLMRASYVTTAARSLPRPSAAARCMASSERTVGGAISAARSRRSSIHSNEVNTGQLPSRSLHESWQSGPSHGTKKLDAQERR